MQRKVLVCRVGDTLSDAEAIMRMGQVRRLPVTDSAGRLVGILSLNDIAVEAGRHPMTPSNGVRLDEVGLTLSAVSYHRNSSHPHA
jgi:CBS domain-containing protein